MCSCQYTCIKCVIIHSTARPLAHICLEFMKTLTHINQSINKKDKKSKRNKNSLKSNVYNKISAFVKEVDHMAKYRNIKLSKRRQPLLYNMYTVHTSQSTPTHLCTLSISSYIHLYYHKYYIQTKLLCVCPSQNMHTNVQCFFYQTHIQKENVYHHHLYMIVMTYEQTKKS